MTKREAQIEYERQLRSISDTFMLSDKLDSDTIFNDIDRGIKQFTDAVYSQYEANQKLTDDLRLLTIEVTPTITTVSSNTYQVTYAEDYQHLLSERVQILPIGVNTCWPMSGSSYVPKDTTVVECTNENLQNRLLNSLSDHKLHYAIAKPLRLRVSNGVKLYTDGTYSVSKYTCVYLKTPDSIKPTVNTVVGLQENYTDLTEASLKQAITIAVSLRLAMMTATKQK